MTGVVNLTIDTLSTPTVAALIILSFYASLLSATVVVADFYGLKLKFW